MSVASDVLPRLLIVDDNPAIHDDIRKILTPLAKNSILDQLEAAMFGPVSAGSTSLDFSIDDAFQGQDALQMVIEASAASCPFDLAIVDMRMPPGWDGVETIEHLWAVDPDLQILICTAFSDYSWDEITDRLGFQDKLLILKKPFDDCELLQAARALSVKRRLLQQSRLSLETLQDLVEKRTKQLAAAHAESESLLNAISSGLIGYDQDGCVIRWNSEAERLFHLSATDAVGKSLRHLPIAWTNADQFQTFFETNRTVEGSTLETTLSGPSEELSVVSITVHPVHDEPACSGGGLVLVQNITQRKMLEQQLQQAQKLESVGQLAAGVAHEINTPMQYVGDNLKFIEGALQKLTPILQWVEQTMKADHPAEAIDRQALLGAAGRTNLVRLLDHLPKAVADAQQGVHNVARIVQAMKEFSHPGSDSPQPVDLNRVLESAVVVSRPEWKYFATVETELDPTLPAVIGFAQELQQVFLNLLVNAAHAVDSRRQKEPERAGCIQVKTARQNDRCLVSIRDNGCGIPATIRKRVFDPFFTTKEVGKGTGQGLAIAHQVVVNNHAGKLWFESEVGEGTTFFVDLPSAAGVPIL